MPLDDTQSRPKPTDARADLDRKLAAVLPRARTTKDRLGLALWAATEAVRLDEASKEKAKRAAVAGGVLPDLTANPLPVGTVETVYSSPLLTIGLKVVRQADRTDVPAMMAYLEKNGVKPALLKRAIKRNTNSMGVANIFTALLVKP